MFGLGAPELMLIFAILFLLFGARKLPDLASGLGGAVHNFKKALKAGADEDARAMTSVSRSDEPVPVPTARSSEPVSKL